MQRIPRDQAMEYELDHRAPPKLRVQQGESFVIETEDAGSGLIRSPDIAPRLDDLPTRKFDPRLREIPLGGPYTSRVLREGTFWRSPSNRS